MELLNPDTSWRVLAGQPGWTPKRHLLEALIDYPFRPQEVLAGLIQPTMALEHWEALTRSRRVGALAGADAHARLAPRNADPGNSRYVLSLPSYESSFRLFSIHVRPDRPFSGRAADDAALLMQAIRAGHVYTALDGVATPPSFEFTATNARGTVHEGDELDVGGSLSLHVRSNAPPGYVTIVSEGGRGVVGRSESQEFTVDVPERPGVFWAEVRAGGRSPDLVWIRGNPVYVRGPAPIANSTPRNPATQSVALFDGASLDRWRVEQDPTSLAAVDLIDQPGGKEVAFRYGLSGGARVGQVAALAVDLPDGIDGRDRITFSIRAEKPMRVSVQVRAGGGEEAGDRWQRSVYVDADEQTQTIYLDEFSPVGQTHTVAPPLASIRTILFVVDTTNTRPGASGRIWIRKSSLQR